ncbi:MAG: nuclear transport factor 2 family protein [Actinomycetota bacterium]|nr:nuclear transport factor 2 family protein [Actinomycetota bacterium]
MTERQALSGQLTTEQAAVWAVVEDLYVAYLDGDRLRLESHLAPDCTMWESALPELRTRQDLVAARNSSQSPPADPQPHTLAAEPLVITVDGDLAVEAHTLRAQFADPSLDQSLRCTSALTRTSGQWRFIHHHEELLAGR